MTSTPQLCRYSGTWYAGWSRFSAVFMPRTATRLQVLATSRASDAERMFDLHEDDIALVTLAMDGPVHCPLSCLEKTGIPASPVQLRKADSQVGVRGRRLCWRWRVAEGGDRTLSNGVQWFRREGGPEDAQHRRP